MALKSAGHSDHGTSQHTFQSDRRNKEGRRYHITDPEKCISCMRCISICPKGARGVDPPLLATIAERISPHLGGRKDNHLFL